MNKFLYVIIAAIFIVPFSAAIPMIGTDVWYPQFLAVLAFVYLGIAFYISKMSKALAFFYVYCIFSTIFIARQHPLSMIYLTQLGLALLMSGHIASLESVQRKKVWWAIFIILIIQCGLGVLQSLSIDPFFRLASNHNLYDVVGFSGSHNQYGLFLASAASAAWLICPLFLPLVLIALILSKTLTTLIAFFAASAFIIFYKYGKLKTVLVLPAVIVAVAVLMLYAPKSGDKLKERVALWRLSIEQVNLGRAKMEVNSQVTRVVACNPWLGYGLGAFFKISPATQGKIIAKGQGHRYEHAHNDFVEVYFDLGRIGSLLLLWVIADLILKFRAVKQKSQMLIASAGSLVAYAFSALCIYTVHVAVGGFYLAVFLGLYFGGLKDEQTRTSGLSTKVV